MAKSTRDDDQHELDGIVARRLAFAHKSGLLQLRVGVRKINWRYWRERETSCDVPETPVEDYA